jgi:hypothetical protein
MAGFGYPLYYAEIGGALQFVDGYTEIDQQMFQHILHDSQLGYILPGQQFGWVPLENYPDVYVFKPTLFEELPIVEELAEYEDYADNPGPAVFEGDTFIAQELL